MSRIFISSANHETVSRWIFLFLKSILWFYDSMGMHNSVQFDSDLGNFPLPEKALEKTRFNKNIETSITNCFRDIYTHSSSPRVFVNVIVYTLEQSSLSHEHVVNGRIQTVVIRSCLFTRIRRLLCICNVLNRAQL